MTFLGACIDQHTLIFSSLINLTRNCQVTSNVSILYRPDKGACTYYITLMGWGVGLGFVILCYIWWGGGFDFCYITLLKLFTYVIF